MVLVPEKTPKRFLCIGGVHRTERVDLLPEFQLTSLRIQSIAESKGEVVSSAYTSMSDNTKMLLLALIGGF